MAAQLRFHPDPSPVLGDLPDRRAAEAWLWPGHRSGNGQARLPRRGPDLRGSPAVGPDELAHLRPARGARARSALGPHLLPGPPTWVECWRGGSALRLGPDQVVEVAFQRTDLGPAVDRPALLRFQHPPFELCMRFARTQLTDGLLSMVTQPFRRPEPLPPDAKSPHLG